MSEKVIETNFTENTEIKDIIIIKQLPVMEQHFQDIHNEIVRRLYDVDKLEVSEETKTENKNLLAELRKEFNTFEERRKQVKAEINKPYDEMYELYKEYIEEPYKEAFNTLSFKIIEIESQQKNKVVKAALEYYNEYRASIGLTFPEYDQSKFRITLSTTMKNLKEQIIKYLDDIKRDIESIQTFNEQADDIMIEYKTTLNLSAAIKTVNDRAKAKQQYETEKANAAEIAGQQAKISEKVDEAIANTEPEPEIKPAEEIIQPVVEEEKKIFPFWAEVTREQFGKLINFMKDEGIKYGKLNANANSSESEHAGT